MLSQAFVSWGCSPTRHQQTPKMGVTDMVVSRVDQETSILRSWKRTPGGYDETAKQVNAAAHTCCWAERYRCYVA